MALPRSGFADNPVVKCVVKAVTALTPRTLAGGSSEIRFRRYSSSKVCSKGSNGFNGRSSKVCSKRCNSFNGREGLVRLGDGGGGGGGGGGGL